MHSGHRQRMRDRIKEQGLDSLNDHEFLEYLLYFVQPRVNTNEQAHCLMREYGSLSRVLESSADSLAKVKGIGPAAAQFLSLLPNICRRYYLDKYSGENNLWSMSDIIEYLRSFYLGENEEIAVIMMFDAQMSFLGAKTVARGNSREVMLHQQKVILEVMQNNAVYVVFSHNHPSNNTNPSADDLVLTNHLSTILNAVNVDLVDHLIFCPNGSYYSFSREHCL